MLCRREKYRVLRGILNKHPLRKIVCNRSLFPTSFSSSDAWLSDDSSESFMQASFNASRERPPKHTRILGERGRRGLGFSTSARTLEVEPPLPRALHDPADSLDGFLVPSSRNPTAASEPRMREQYSDTRGDGRVSFPRELRYGGSCATPPRRHLHRGDGRPVSLEKG